MSPRLWAVLAFGVWLGMAGCSNGAVTSASGSGGGSGLPSGAGVGDSCTSQACRAGLVCQSGLCAPGHSTAENQSCILSAECQAKLQCLSGTCQPAGPGAQGDTCRGDGDCQAGLRCGLVGFSAQCIPEGSNGLDKTCTTSADCFSGLACSGGLCEQVQPGSPSFGVPLWQGVTCSAPVTDPSVKIKAYFEVPGVKSPAGDYGDFFRLPFPNDILTDSGKLDLTGFPTPGKDLLGFDPVQRYVDALEKEDTGWGTYPTVIFRFSGAIDFATFQGKSGSASPVNWVDITKGDPAYGSSSGLGYYYSGGPTHYVCDNWFGVRRPLGRPLTPGHTYAVWLTTAGLDSHDKAIQSSLQLQKLLSSNATPTDPVLAKAYTAYQPFRDYLKDKSIDPATILNATVITAGNVRDPMAGIAKTIDSLPAPTAKSWVKCASGVKSPCPQATGDRACGNGDPAYDEYDALVTLPIFQQGTEPYKDTGGNVTDQVARSEDVCMALTVPKGTMPANGWPLVVYAHGTGGSYRSHIRPEVAGALSSVTAPDGKTVEFAVLGIDQVEHGPRRGSSTDSPDNLFFNFANPDAARGNPIQGAADQLSLARFAASLDVTAADTGGAAIKADPNAIMFFGQSQGSTEGSLALPYTNVYKAAVLSGNGAALMYALLNKTSPVNIAGALPFVLADYDSSGGLAGGDMNPALSLFQEWEDPADPLNFANAIARTPITGMTPKHIFQTYGIGDTYAPPVTLQAFALAAGLDEAAPDASVTTADKIGSLSPKKVPLSGNVTIGGSPYTLAVREYAPPSGDDGHFVVFDVKNANADAVRFLAMAAEGLVPQVGK